MLTHWEWRFAIHWWILRTWKKIKLVVSAKQMILWVWNLLSTCVCYGITQGVGVLVAIGKGNGIVWIYTSLDYILYDGAYVLVLLPFNTFHYYYSFIKSYVRGWFSFVSIRMATIPPQYIRGLKTSCYWWRMYMDILDTAGQEYSAIVVVNTVSAEFIGIFIDKLQISFTITIIMKKQTKFTYECV